ncbi:MAG: M28 family peptidase [Tannerella sp.]|jgi:Zn-dependent M28 family amino/carboxypeptidase|nr:M28 family peptidase [Tannerella sp.]
MKKFVCLILGSLFLSCCSRKSATGETDASAKSTFYSNAGNVGEVEKAGDVPVFDADSAYSYVAKQVAFGPRVPNTPAHKACADYLASGLKRHGAEIYVQETVLTAYNGDKLQARNIIGVFNPGSQKRILLFAHWDSRPYSDHDPDETNHRKPLDGADDGASGVGVLLEIARQIGLNNLRTGVDIIFFDAEDYGTPEFVREYKEDTWCLGSQFWAKNPHVSGYKADFGILLDMVGHKEATFYKEGSSVSYAAPVVEMVWNTARNLGYGKYFVNAKGSRIIDDHEYVIKGRNIPCIDIIYLKPDTPHGFGMHWHTQHDTMDRIDKNVLKAVGQTVLEVIYNHSK